jgi:outer membrane protein assembly factor BamB
MRFVLLLPLLVSCSTLSWKPSPVGEKRAAWSRGWAYIESEKEFLGLESGVTPISYSGPVVSGEKLIVGSDRFGVMALSKSSGQSIWRQNISGGVSTLPLISDKSIFVGSDFGNLYRLHSESGKVSYEVSLGAPIHGSMILVLDRLFVATADEGVHSIDPSTGKILWTYRRPAFSGTSVRGGGNLNFIAGKIWTGFSDGALVALNPQTGALENERIFRDNLKFVDVDAKVVGWKDNLLVINYDGKLRLLRKDLTTLWEFDAGGARTPLVTEDDVIYISSSNGIIYAIQASSGKEIWQQPLRRGVPTGLALLKKEKGKYLAVASSEERAYLLNADSGKIVSDVLLGKGSGSYSPLVADPDTNSFYLLTSYSRIYQMRLEN